MEIKLKNQVVFNNLNKYEALKQEASNIKVLNNDEYEATKKLATVFKNKANELLDILETDKKALYVPYKNKQEEIKVIETRLKDLVAIIMKPVNDWYFEEEKRKAIEFEKTQKKAEKLEDKTGIEMVVKKQETSTKGLTKRTKIDIEIIDIDKVPTQFIKKELKLNEAKEAYKANKAQIAGLKITEKEVLE